MRLVGTGTAPEGQYIEGQICDASDEVGAGLIEKGWVEELPADEDPARSRLQMANAAVRGENAVSEEDLEAAEEWHGTGTNPEKGTDPYPAVFAQDPDADAEEVDTTPKAKGGKEKASSGAASGGGSESS